MQALRVRASEPEVSPSRSSSQLTGRWSPDSLSVFAWDAARSDEGLCPHDGYRVLRLDLDAPSGALLVLGHEWTDGDAAGLGECMYPQRQS
ncbi:MAG: hypothetical protein AAFU38_19685 [Bacteroidota bacterium]